MILQSSSASFNFSQIQLCPCKNLSSIITNQNPQMPSFKRRRKKLITNFSHRNFRRKFSFRASVIPNDTNTSNLNIARQSTKKFLLAKQFSNEFETQVEKEEEEEEEEEVGQQAKFTSFQEDPLVDKLRTQLGVIHPIPAPPINRNVAGLFVFFFFVGVAFDKLWTSRKRNNKMGKEGGMRGGGGVGGVGGVWPQVPTSFSLFLEKDLMRKESVEWVNMVLGKLWKVYRGGIENWIIGLLQPVIDNLKKPDYVQRVEIKQFSLGDEPLSVRNVERRTSRRVNDLQ